MKISTTPLDRIMFAAVAILVVVVVILILFGCSGPTWTDEDGGPDAAADTDTDTPDAGTEDDAGTDAAVDTDTADASLFDPCPFSCAMPDFCLEINGQIVDGDCPGLEGAVCCHLEYWPDAGF